MPATPPPSLPTSSRSQIAANIRRLRKALGLTQEKLAEMAEFHPTYISLLERCKANISIDGLERIARILGVTTTALLQPAEQAAADTPATSDRLIN